VLRKEEKPSREQEQLKKHIVMVGLWPCMVSSEVHINGRCVSELVWEDKGKATVLESEDEKDLKRTQMVLSKGCEVVEPGYSRLSRDAAILIDRGGELGNPNRVHWEYDTDRQTDRVTWDSRGNRDGYSGQQANQVTRVSQGNRDSNLKSGNSSRLPKIRLLRKARVRRSRLTWKTGLCKTQKAGNRKKERVLLQAKG
jgi:hypothetical protein